MIKKFLKYLMHEPLRIIDACVARMNAFLPDRVYLSLRYRCQVGSWIDWKKPRTFSEKIQWLKVYGFKPEYSKYIDKFAVKEIIANKIGREYIIPTIGVWTNVDDIAWLDLPNKYVLKITDEGGSNGVYICSNSNNFKRDEVVKKIAQIMNKKKRGKDIHREHPYEYIPRKIIAEKYIECNSMNQENELCDLTDYKFYCFNGKPRYCQIIRNRRTKETIDFYDMEWNHMPFVGLNPAAKNGLNPVEKPKNLNVMIDLCEKLSKEFYFVRVDMYNVDGTVYFGELTFYPASGFGVFEPDEWNYKLGDLLKLPLEALK